MFLKMFDRWCEWMKANGRMYVVVYYTGQISAYRFYPLFVEKPWKALWSPNVFFHRAGDLRGAHELLHAHPWSLCSIVISGGYDHIHKGKLEQINAPGFIRIPQGDLHAIHDVKPSTISVVFHWFRTGKNSKFFYNENPDRRYGVVTSELPHSGAAVLQWTPELQAKIDRRKAAMKRLGKIL